MKALVLFLSLFVATASASAVTPHEFIESFVAQTNKVLQVTNDHRGLVGKRLYCEALSSDQITLIAATAMVPGITVGDFVNTVAEDLKCYPVFFPPWGRKSVGGMLFNSKAYIMDITLIQDVLRSLNEGKLPESERLLVESYDPYYFEILGQ
ncbi:hypothetical protein EZJ49_04445 [Bdellovibrio bacteriovorus]|uniref:hypothetical protein n=1 Tax=Bdellovibrio bacteriovorus TaxID=959 RepID=UPI0021CF7F4D|nr:hypothetical protein [Bdellovibrio bacteriovorus]UXR65502.1 hypothetical protein EZJ49_04445 [Bdellovibrio bacteriovorus]